MECVLGATGEARKGESWTVANIARYQSRFYGYAGIIRCLVCLHLHKMSLMSSNPSDWFLSSVWLSPKQDRIIPLEFEVWYQNTLLHPSLFIENVPTTQLLRGRDRRCRGL
jgi:hypothetical protein